MTATYPVIVEWDSDDHVFVTDVPTLDFLSTFGETREQAIANTHEAIVGYLEAAEKEGLPLTPPGPGYELIAIAV